MRVYLDHNATTPLDERVLEAMLPFLRGEYGNPSSLHGFGQRARAAVEEARERVARLIGAAPAEIVFTASGSESDNMALRGVAAKAKATRRKLVVSGIEHHAVLNCAKALRDEGWPLAILGVPDTGRLAIAELEAELDDTVALLSLMLANNETGVVQPVAEAARLAHARGAVVHCDAVQAAGKLAIEVRELGVDLLTLSAHKLYGPKGVGCLYVRRGTPMAPLVRGGGQERGRRAGTENVAGIVGLATALEIALADMTEEAARQTALRDRLIEGLLRISGVQLNGHPTERLPNNVSISVDYVEGESMLLNLDLEGICVSTGSACSSTSAEPSHVLTALNIAPEKAHCSLRFTLGKWTTDADIDRVLAVFPPMVQRLRAMSPLANR